MITQLVSGGGGSAAITGSLQGTAAARPAPAAAPAGALYWATDTGEISVNNLAQNAWQTIGTTSNSLFHTNALQMNAVGSSGLRVITALGTMFDCGFASNVLATISGADFDVNSVGRGYRVAEGANAKQGVTGAMTAGSVTVANTSVTASSRIFVCRGAGGTNPGAWYVSAQTAGTSFVVTSTNAADTGNGVFEIFEPG